MAVMLANEYEVVVHATEWPRWVLLIALAAVMLVVIRLARRR